MCGHGHEHRAHGYGRARGRAFGGPLRGGFPPREEWVERLQAYHQHLEQELANVRELIDRLGPASPAQGGTV